jgi:hypothetical protein
VKSGRVPKYRAAIPLQLLVGCTESPLEDCSPPPRPDPQCSSARTHGGHAVSRESSRIGAVVSSLRAQESTTNSPSITSRPLRAHGVPLPLSTCRSVHRSLKIALTGPVRNARCVRSLSYGHLLRPTSRGFVRGHGSLCWHWYYYEGKKVYGFSRVARKVPTFNFSHPYGDKPTNAGHTA